MKMIIKQCIKGNLYFNEKYIKKGTKNKKYNWRWLMQDNHYDLDIFNICRSYHRSGIFMIVRGR